MTKDETPYQEKTGPYEEEENPKEMHPTRRGGGCSKMVGKNRQRISLAWLSVHGTRHAFGRAKNLQDKWKADTKMIQAIDCLPGKKTKTERVVKKIMQTKKRLKL